MVYENRLVLHIPHCKWDGELTDVDYRVFEELIYNKLNEAGAGFYTTLATGHYRGRRYLESLITVFADDTTVSWVTEMFGHEFQKHNDLMCQESFAYELNGKLYVLNL